MRNSIGKWLIAKWLFDGPKTGYELLKLYEQAFGRASPGTIYPMLSQMERKGLVVKNGDKYALTENGHQLLADIESKRAEIMEESRKKLVALADVLDDDRLRRYAEYLPIMGKVHPGVLDILSDVELLSFELGERAIPILEETVKKLEEMRSNGASSTT
ncbi:MAG: PadR family transcriptional regulator [Candidatus Diapherotrites archaeon]|nr:PadR family transcriptional regulator [Candidatus Diapherotrites archaeon]